MHKVSDIHSVTNLGGYDITVPQRKEKGNEDYYIILV